MKTKIVYAALLLLIGVIGYECFFLPQKEKESETKHLNILKIFEPLVHRSITLRDGIVNVEHKALCDSLGTKGLLDSLSVVYQMCMDHLLIYNDTSINKTTKLVFIVAKADCAYLGFQRYLGKSYNNTNPWVIDGKVYYP